MSIQFIYFDLDDTLLDHKYAERKALDDVRADFPEVFDGVSLDRIHQTYRSHSIALWKQYGQGTIDKATLKRRRFEQLLQSIGHDETDAAPIADHYLNCYIRHWRFVPAARTAFKRLADAYPVGVLTNGFTEIQQQKLSQFPVLRERSSAVVICEETGYLKPHPQVFAHATERAGTPPNQILYVGDSHHSDVKGGQAAGWQVAWYTRNSENDEDARSADCLTFQEWDTLLNALL